MLDNSDMKATKNGYDTWRPWQAEIMLALTWKTNRIFKYLGNYNVVLFTYLAHYVTCTCKNKDWAKINTFIFSL